MVFSSIPWENVKPSLIIDDSKIVKIHFTRQSSMNGVGICDFSLDTPIELGHSYKVVSSRYGTTPLDVTDYTSFPGFDEEFLYEGNDLGYTYSSDKCQFVLWAPLASKVVLKIQKPGEDSYSMFEMKREDKGVYRVTILGDYKNSKYKYLVTNSEVETEVTDPYAKGSTLNGKESVVIDFESIKVPQNKDKLPLIKSPTEAIIYETHVRDFTISRYSNIEHKGTFLGMSEEGKTTMDGLPAGIDYLKSLGITHVQLLPINDYKTADEEDPSALYNWGYDPAQYFVPEGSYGSNSNPESRVRDLKILISTLNKAGIRVCVDVVFNHVYAYETSVLEKIVPNYFFRKRENDTLTNSSGCGNDLASEKPMVAKLIFDAVKFWIDEYGIDSLRFDLMGIIDCALLNKIAAYAKTKDPSFLLYGEGWNMGSYSPNGVGTIENQSLIPEYGFFNDDFRNTVKYYFVGDDRFVQSMKCTYVGNCVDGFIKQARFPNASKSLNYAECHDNETLYDFIEKCDSSRTEKENLDILKAINASVIFSHGMPFVHMGQEIGQSKWKEENTYNKGDYFNKFSYRLLGERIECFESIKQAISIKKSLQFLNISNPTIIDKSINITDFNHVIHIEYIDKNLINPFKQFHIFLNPNNKSEKVDLNNVEILYSTKEIDADVHVVPERSFIIFVER